MKDGKIWICTNMGGVSILDLQHNAFISAEEIDFQNIKAPMTIMGYLHLMHDVPIKIVMVIYG